MRIRYGYDIELVSQHELPLVTLLDVHPSRRHDLVSPDEMTVTALADPAIRVPVSDYIDQFGNICRRIVAPPGGVRLHAEGYALDSGEPDPVHLSAREVPPARLPEEALVYLLGSRYCETDKLAGQAWSLFGHIAPGW